MKQGIPSLKGDGFVSIDRYESVFANWTGEVGLYQGFNFIKAKGESIWVRTKPRNRYPKREIKLWR